MNEIIKPKSGFWAVSIIAIIWNILGVLAYIGSVTLSPEQMEAMSEAERNIRETTPAWATSAFALATFLGLLGSILLVLRKAVAEKVFMLSFIAILVQFYYALILVDSMAIHGVQAVIMPMFVIIIGFGLIIYSRKCKAKGLLK